MPYAFTTKSDGVGLYYTDSKPGDARPEIVLLHGWSGSHRMFDLQMPDLTARCRVIAPDLRFHGGSDKPAWGFHVARLAADLHELLEHLNLAAPTLVGCSLGAAVIWSYVELYGCENVGKLVFVDQAPSQWRMDDWALCSKGIYDAPSLAKIQKALRDGLAAFADGNAECCLTKRVPAQMLATLKSETERCDAHQLGKLMADHACKDWRPLLPRIKVPVLNLYGTCSGCFPQEGCAAVGDAIGDNARNVPFEGCNHWLYMEEPVRFNQLLIEFVFEPPSE